MRHLVIWRRANQNEAHPWQRSPKGANQCTVAVLICLRVALVLRRVPAIVHPEHDGYNGWVQGQNVSFQARLHIPCVPALNRVSANTGVVETHSNLRITRDRDALGKPCIKALCCDAVAIEHHPVATPQSKWRVDSRLP